MKPDAPVSQNTPEIAEAIERMPRGLFVITAAHDAHRGGALVRFVQPCANTPLMIMVAIEKGQTVEPLIRDSRAFTLCQIHPEDRMLVRKFGMDQTIGEDPFVMLSTRMAPSGSPILDRAVSFIDCEVVRHFDIEADHGILIGLVHHAGLLRSETEAAEVTDETSNAASHKNNGNGKTNGHGHRNGKKKA